ncbi:MAG: glycogen synthase [Candidatus Krumholzibacteriia bacterium]
MDVLYVSREYPPHVYGGAGVHMEHLAREMAALAQVRVLHFEGDGRTAPAIVAAGAPESRLPNPRDEALPFGDDLFAAAPPEVRTALQTLQTDLVAAARPPDADIVHVHTWYAHLAGVLVKLAYGVPLVVTVHSLEPRRPWKREQLGRGYDISTWVERTALTMADRVICVSDHDRDDVLSLFDLDPERVITIPNGIDADFYHPASADAAVRGHGIDPERPYVFCLGRITRQKGIVHFLAAARHLDPDLQVVLCASGPDTPEIAREVEEKVAALQGERAGVVWIPEMVARETARELYAHATVFCCPSIYEPFGIINLEAMACRTPVVASAVGGIPEIVVHGETGLLVPITPRSPTDAEPADPGRFAHDLAAAIGEVVADPARRAAMGEAGRRRVLERFSWSAVARRVHAVYRQLLDSQEVIAS